jgi:hypothetical protein
VPITYDIPSNTITVVGGPYGFIDIYNADVAGGWGVFFNPTATQFYTTAKIVIGDGVTATIFLDSNKQITWVFAAGATTVIFRVTAAATVTFGILNDAATFDTSRGCDFILSRPWGQDSFAAQTATSTLYFYSCSFAALGGCQLVVQGAAVANTIRVWNCLFKYQAYLIELGTSCNIYNVNIQDVSAFGAALAGIRATNVNKINAIRTTRYINNYGAGDNTYSNIYGRNAGLKAVRVENNIPRVAYLINPDFDVWTFDFVGTATIFRQYNFDLKVTDQDNNPLANATVAVRDNAGTLIFSVLTNAAGDIVTQTVNRGYYQQATGDTLQDYSPHALTITRAGYQTYHKHFTLTAKITWEIKLVRISQILLDQGNPVLNIVPTDPENKQVLNLS